MISSTGLIFQQNLRLVRKLSGVMAPHSLCIFLIYGLRYTRCIILFL